MIEILLIIFLCNKMGSTLRTKGWEKTFWMQFLVAVVYLGSLFAGSLAYVIYVGITEGEAALDKLGIVLYLAAYVGAFIGVGALFLSTKLIKNRILPRNLKDADRPAAAEESKPGGNDKPRSEWEGRSQ